MSSDETGETFSTNEAGNRLSSAYLNVQFPLQNKSNLLVPCAIDARWVEGRIIGSGIAQSSGAQSYNASVIVDGLDSPGMSAEFPARSSTRWRAVQLGRDWLEALTPSMNTSREGYTTLSSLLETVGIDNRAGNADSSYAVQTATEAAVVALVVNRMAHSGYVENGGAVGNMDEARSFFPIPSADRDILDLFAGTLEVPAPGGTSSSDLNSTTMRWSLFISGMVYSANDTGSWLSLTVIFVHALLALLHTAYTLWRRKTSGAWESFCDFFALALGSTSTTEIQTISSGITDPHCLRKGLVVRELQTSANGSAPTNNRLQIIFNGAVGLGSTCTEVQLDKKY